MTTKKLLLGTTALLGAGLFAADASAAEIKPGGALDLTISGFARFLATYGDQKEKTGTRTGSYDFRNDYEVWVKLDGRDESTGIKYGGTIEFEADTNETLNTDESWIYLSGEFGEFRFGDEDGPEDNMRLGAPSISAGTGGIDGSGPIDINQLFAGLDTTDATKVIYYSPKIAGFQLGVAYTPHRNGDGQEINLTDDNSIDDIAEGGVAYVNSFGSFDLKASLTGYTGESNVDHKDFTRWNAGAVVGFAGFSVAGGYTNQNAGSDVRQWYNLGVAGAFGPAKVSVSWGDTLSADDNSEPSALYLSATVGLMPGVSLDGDIAWFNLDRPGNVGFGDDGYLGIVRLAMSF